jgi:hypothetical protein
VRVVAAHPHSNDGFHGPFFAYADEPVYNDNMPDERPTRRAAVVCRHPATLRPVIQAVGIANLGLRQVISPAMLPRSQRGEFECVVLDLDLDPQIPPLELVRAVHTNCPETQILCVAGTNTKTRLVESLQHPSVAGLFPKIGSWLETPAMLDGPDEQELAVAIRRLVAHAPIPQGPTPYLIGGSPVEERLIASTAEKDEALQAVLQLGLRIGLSDEKLRRIEVSTDELLMNAMFDAPRDEQGRPRFAALTDEERATPQTFSAKEQVRLRFGSDARSFAISVHDKFGTLTREAVATHIARILEAGGPRPRPAGSSASGGAGLGLVLTFGAANQLVVQTIPGKFTDMTAVIHIAGSNRSALSRGTSLQMYFN